MTYLMNKARREYYTNFIDEISGDQRKLFKASKSLINHGNGSIFPPCANDQDLANEFGDFFVQKILDINSAIISTSHQSTNALPVESVTDVSFPEFNLLSE